MGVFTQLWIAPKLWIMLTRDLLRCALPFVVTQTYACLVFWMHIWALEAGPPEPGRPTTPHHQICTWIGTSGEAGLTSCSPITPSQQVGWFNGSIICRFEPCEPFRFPPSNGKGPPVAMAPWGRVLGGSG